MTKLQEIEKKLLSINDAVFQNVCDAYLYFTESEYPDIVRPGSQKGKQKTTKGTPDSYFTLKNGKYVLVEYTTKAKKENPTAFLKKVYKDLKSCLDPKITGIAITEIEKIIYCCNATLSSKETKELISFCTGSGVRLEIKTIDTLAMGLLGRCPQIAKEFLNITIDTGQILKPETFISEYESSGYATPLSNKFLYREKELQQLCDSILSSQISIVTGPAGVGKSKLVLAAFQNLKTNNKKLTTYVISNKNASIHDDLRVYLSEDKTYLILIDDANRQLGSLVSILSILKEKKKRKISIVITVRDYAYEHVRERCNEFISTDISLNKFTDDEIKGILISEDFKIRNHKYQERILAIADGNPRLAIMAAKVALDINKPNGSGRCF